MRQRSARRLRAGSARATKRPSASWRVIRRGALIAGLNGASHWRWLYVRHLWVEASQRGRGLGRRLMAEAERLAKDRGCVGIYVDTFDPQAAAFYEDIGFTRVGEIVGFPPGHQRLFFRKSLQ